MKVAVVGCGYVGLVSAVGLATVGHDVVGVEAHEGRRQQVAAGVAPFHEPGLQESLQAVIAAGRLRVSADVVDTADADVVLLAVQTPPDAGGAIDLQYLQAAAEAVAEAFQRTPRRRVVATRSTVVPGTADHVVAPAFRRAGTDTTTSVASNPEFLREGSALDDFLHPDRIVVGCRDEWGQTLLEEVYRPLGAPVIATMPATAELAKYTSNAFLATLISFSNEIARICETQPGVDVEDVLAVLHLDRRLRPPANGSSPAAPEILSYLKAGCGYGGSCLPKDLSALIAHAENGGLPVPLLEAVRTVNEDQPDRVVTMVADALGGLQGRTVTVLGVAFKAGTDDLRDSPGLKVVRKLLDGGASVRVHDPLVVAAALPSDVRARVTATGTLGEAVATADACVLTTNAPEFATLASLLDDKCGSVLPVIVDGRRLLHADQLASAGYYAVGRAPLSATPQGEPPREGDSTVPLPPR